MKKYRAWNPDQSFLLPPSPREWLPEGHLVFFILDVIAALDLTAITRAVQAKDARGERPYAPAMMLALLIYGYCVGVFSSRRIAQATYEDVAFRVLAAGEHPHFTRIAAFRHDHLATFKGLFLQALKLCQKAGLVKLGHVAFDGTRVDANASKHKAMSYERMQVEEARLRKEIDALLAQAQQADAAEDARFGVGQSEQDVPAELARRETRLARIQAAKHELEQEALHSRMAELSEQAEGSRQTAQNHPDLGHRHAAATNAAKRDKQRQELAAKLDDDGDDQTPHGGAPTSEGLPTHRVPATPEGKPDAKAQRNFTDSDSRIVERGGSFVQGYNCQLAVDDRAQIIVAEAVTNNATDNGNFLPMLEQTKRNCGRTPENASADTGYWQPEVESQASALGTNAFIATGRERTDKGALSKSSDAGPDDDPRNQMRKKVASPSGKAIYRRRKAIVEPVNGQIKEARGFRRFHLRGWFGVRGEWSLVCACHNLLKLFQKGEALAGCTA
jgi:transposase